MILYELFVLGELLIMPMHGYKLHRIVREAIGPIRQMSWSALYPLLRQLEQDGMISGVEEISKGGRQRKQYQITPAGEARFRSLMAQPGAYDTDYPDLIGMKMSDFHLIDNAGRLNILRDYRGYVQHIETYLLAAIQHITEDPNIPDVERPYILRSIDRRMHVTQADLEWVDAEIEHYADLNE